MWVLKSNCRLLTWPYRARPGDARLQSQLCRGRGKGTSVSSGQPGLYRELCLRNQTEKLNTEVPCTTDGLDLHHGDWLLDFSNTRTVRPMTIITLRPCKFLLLFAIHLRVFTAIHTSLLESYISFRGHTLSDSRVCFQTNAKEIRTATWILCTQMYKGTFAVTDEELEPFKTVLCSPVFVISTLS